MTMDGVTFFGKAIDPETSFDVSSNTGVAPMRLGSSSKFSSWTKVGPEKVGNSSNFCAVLRDFDVF